MFCCLFGGSPKCTEKTCHLEIKAWLLVISGNQGSFGGGDGFFLLCVWGFFIYVCVVFVLVFNFIFLFQQKRCLN